MKADIMIVVAGLLIFFGSSLLYVGCNKEPSTPVEVEKVETGNVEVEKTEDVKTESEVEKTDETAPTETSAPVDGSSDPAPTEQVENQEAK